MIAPPNKKQLLNIRLMILIGIGCTAFFTYHLLNVNARGYRPLYILLIVTFIFTIAKILYEWYHYWSIKIAPPPAGDKVFTVDIFTTFCAGEPYEMIVETLEAIQKISYPHQTYLCDEDDDAYLKNICKQLGVHHITRTDKTDAKAGNINNALKYSTGELCVVLDPDHVPFPDFLDPIVGHFNNPEVGYVQIVQAYYNQDQGWIAKGAAQQTYQYYGPMMMTMNAYGTAQAIGANCTFRRAALESIGGHAAGLAEDMHTSMQLHAQGWKSVYVPAVLSRGLVPATLSAYYKQQLKWSRGVFELFVTSYIKLFKNFTWRQKLHYGLVPMFYLSGFIYLLNFMIPVFSLFADVYPLRMDFSIFSLISLPFITAVVIIRHYMQRWVMEDHERGFHIIGGLVLIGTWWVFIVGLFYTIIRRKVPYIPTPKDVANERNLIINLPNAGVLSMSLAAIIYGLYNDWNPYTFIMAGICGINCFFMVFMLVASQQHKVRSYKKRHHKLTAVSTNIGTIKQRFWVLRRKMYSGMRSISLMLIVLSICIAFYSGNKPYKNNSKPAAPSYKNILLTGIFDPPTFDNGITDMGRVNSIQHHGHIHFDIISIYIPWGDSTKSFIPARVMDNIYRNKSTPMVTWEPWQNLFKGAGAGKDEHVFQHIMAGRYDDYISKIAQQLRALNRPVFLRFAHEADNPLYPWSAKGGNTAAEFKAAWQYVHHLFMVNSAWNVLWVWNPWRAETAASYFPGKAYVDWIGITGLNYGRYGSDGVSYSFKQLYSPFHNSPINKLNIPVMIAEMGTAKGNQAQATWLQTGIKNIRTDFKEVKAIVLFNSAFDKNVPNYSVAAINWRQDSLDKISTLLKSNALPDAPPAATVTVINRTRIASRFNANMHGVIYQKGQNWFGDRYAINRQTIINDFNAMRASGFNMVKIYGPGVYDHITFLAAQQTGMTVNYSFWVPDAPAFIDDEDCLPALATQILRTVNNLKENKHIKFWNIGNFSLQQLDGYYLQPQLFYRAQAYVGWLRNLVRQIKKADPSRAVTVDANVAPDLVRSVTQLHDQIPEIDAFGLILKNNLKDTDQIRKLPAPYYYSNIRPGLFFRLGNLTSGVLMGNWQDQQTASGVTFNGLKDIWGRNKPGFYKITNHWTAAATNVLLPRIKILRPSLATIPGTVLPYYALVRKYDKWHLAQYLPTGLKFEWYQVHTDIEGNALDMQLISTEAFINYTVPQNPQQYRLYLIGVKGNDVTTAYSILNIPFKNAAQ